MPWKRRQAKLAGVRRALGGLVVLVAMLCPSAASAAEQTETFDQSVFWTAPPNVTSVTFDVYGAQGGSSIYFPDDPGGLGGRATGAVDVVPGARYTIIVGSSGQTSFDPPVPSGGGDGSVVRWGVTRLIAAGGGTGGGAGGPGAPGGSEVDQFGNIDGGSAGSASGGASWGPPGTEYESGVRAGNGLVTATYDPTPPDTDPPAIKITEQPKRKVKTESKKVEVQVSFTSSEPGTTFECRLDKEAFAECESPYSVKAKARRGDGAKHRIVVRGSDAAGNVAEPVSVRFRAIRKQ